MPADEIGCLLWTAHLKSSGYGEFTAYGRRNVPAHRFAYELLVGPIPSGLHLDHLCRERRCVRPDHLEPVTPGENVRRGEGVSAINARKTVCPQGHPLSGENLYRKPDGRRVCRACRRDREGGPEFRARRREYLRGWRRRRQQGEVS
nr:HNH endonuclease signature motif containing protein [Streptomyces sp. SID2119]